MIFYIDKRHSWCNSNGIKKNPADYRTSLSSWLSYFFWNKVSWGPQEGEGLCLSIKQTSWLLSKWVTKLFLILAFKYFDVIFFCFVLIFMQNKLKLNWFQQKVVFFRVPLDFCPALCSTTPPSPSNLPEKLIICHIASVLSRTPMRGSSRKNKTPIPVRPFLNRALDATTKLGRWTHGAILMCFGLFGCIQRGHLRPGFLFTVTAVNGTMQLLFSFLPQTKVTHRGSLCSTRDLVHPLPSYSQSRQHGEGHILLTAGLNTKSLPLKAHTVK